MIERPIYNPETKVVTFAGKEYRLIENPYLLASDKEFFEGYIKNEDVIKVFSGYETFDISRLKNEYEYVAAAVDEAGQEYEIIWYLWDVSSHRPMETWRNEERWKRPLIIRIPFGNTIYPQRESERKEENEVSVERGDENSVGVLPKRGTPEWDEYIAPMRKDRIARKKAAQFDVS